MDNQINEPIVLIPLKEYQRLTEIETKLKVRAKSNKITIINTGDYAKYGYTNVIHIQSVNPSDIIKDQQELFEEIKTQFIEAQLENNYKESKISELEKELSLIKKTKKRTFLGIKIF